MASRPPSILSFINLHSSLVSDQIQDPPLLLNVMPSVPFHWEQFLSVPLTLKILTFLRGKGSCYVCRKSLHLALSNVASQLGSGYIFLAQMSQ